MSGPFWQTWPSWVVELASGLLTVALTLAITLAVPRPYRVILTVALPTVLSLIYESIFDPNGFSWEDVGQRSVGIALGLTAWAGLNT